MRTSKMELYVLINYSFKYYELLDTVFLTLRKRPLTFLHVYHHAAAILLCWVALEERVHGGWIPITINLTVHVFMYYYFYVAAGGKSLPWKRQLTQFQVVQFIIDVTLVGYGVSFMFSSHFPSFGPYAAYLWPSLPDGQKTCAASYKAAIVGAPILTSYLFLFTNFYLQNYAHKAARAGKGKSE